MALFVCAMLLVVLSGAFKPLAIDMSALSASVRDEIGRESQVLHHTQVCAPSTFVFPRCRVQPRT